MIDKEQLQNLLDILRLPYCILNKQGVFTKVNEEYCDLYGYSPSELIGNHFAKLYESESPLNEIEEKKFLEKKKENQQMFLNSFGKYKNFFEHPVSYTERDKDGNFFRIQTISYDFIDNDGLEYRLAIDCREGQKVETGTFNENINENSSRFISFNYLKKEIDKYIVLNEKPEFSIINIKLMNSIVNEKHKNNILDKVHDNLLHILGTNSLITYTSNNRFIIFYKDVTCINVLEEKSKQIIEFFNTPIKIEKDFFKENIKIGISCYTGINKLEFNELYNETEIAIRFSKVDAFVIYNDSLLEQLNQEINFNSIIFDGYKNKEFTAYYQTYYDTSTKKIAGMEALMRLESAKYGLIFPGSFIPLLEKNFFIVKVEKQIIELIFKNMNKWKEKVIPVSINLSSLQFKNIEFLDFLKEKISLYNIDPKDITFEITESTLMEDISLSCYMLNEFKKIGFRLSVDDFGTGYSSLAYLKEFPIDNLKVDMSFIRDIHLSSDKQAIVGAIILMAKKLGLETICEGVEKEEELVILEELGADFIQGYIFSKPVNEKTIEDYIREY